MNQKIFKFRNLLLVCLSLAIAGAMVVRARNLTRPDVKLSLTGTVQRGDQIIQVAQAGLINPGEIISYTITAHNAGTAAAREVSPSAAIPAGTIYVAGSARPAGAARIVYSIDGGKTFQATPMIEQRQPDGTVKPAPAPVAMYTQVRSDLSEPLLPGQQFTVTYQVRVK